MPAHNLKVVKSIQVETKRHSSTTKLQRQSLKKAHRNGMPWSDDEVARLIAGIDRDETSYEIALATGRTYYGIMGARSSVMFALRHANAFLPALQK